MDIAHYLGNLEKGQNAVIIGIIADCKEEIRQRLLDIGFVRGTKISLQNKSPLNDPKAYLIHDTLISLRKEDAQKVLIEIKE